MRSALHAAEVWLCTAAVLAVCVPAGALTVTITQPADHTVFVKGDSDTFTGVLDDFGDEYALYYWEITDDGDDGADGWGVERKPGPKTVECGPRVDDRHHQRKNGKRNRV